MSHRPVLPIDKVKAQLAEDAKAMGMGFSEANREVLIAIAEIHPGFKMQNAKDFLVNHTDPWSTQFARALCRRMIVARRRANGSCA